MPDNDGVELAGIERRDHAVEGLDDDLAFDFHVIAEIFDRARSRSRRALPSGLVKF